MSSERISREDMQQRSSSTLRRLLRLDRNDYRLVTGASGLPLELRGLADETCRRTGLRGSEKVEVARELIAHFEAGMESGASAEELAKGFGNAGQAARLIGRAKRRQRSAAWRAYILVSKAIGWTVVGLIVLYAALAIRFFSGKPNPARDYLAELQAPIRAIPESERAWPKYRDALMAMEAAPTVHAESAPLPGEDGWEEVSAWLERNRGPIGQMRQAGLNHRHMGYVPRVGYHEEDYAYLAWAQEKSVAEIAEESERQIASTSGMYQLPETVATVLPILAEVRKVARLLWDDARLAALKGESTRFFEDVLACVGVAMQVRDQRILISDLVCQAILAGTFDLVVDTLADHPGLLTDEQLRGLAHRVAALDAEQVRVRTDGERAFFEDMLQCVYTDDGEGDGRLTPAGLRVMERLTEGPGVEWAEEAGFAVVAPAAMAVDVGRAALRRKYEELMAMVADEASKPLWDRNVDRLDEELNRIADDPIARVRYMPVSLMMPALSRISVNTELVMQRRDGTLTAIAIELFRRENNAFPESLEALAPRYLPAVPIDRLSGRSLGYLLRGGKPFLYSVGTDRDDDGGRGMAADEAGLINGLGNEQRARLSDTTSTPDADWILFPRQRQPLRRAAAPAPEE